MLVAAISIAIYTAWLYICYNYANNTTYQEHHVNAYFYPVSKVYAGQTMLVDFKNLYGFYPYFIVPILKLIGGLTEYNFSLVIAGLMLLGSLSIIYTLFTACENRIIAYVGSIAAIFTAGIFLLGTYNNVGYYLQYFPQRYLFPAIMLAVCSLFLRGKKPSTLFWTKVLGFIVSTIALLWNLDSGIVVFVAWSAFQIYLLAAQYSLRDKTLYKKAGMVILSAAGQVLCAMGFIVLVTYARAGIIPNLKDAFFGQSVFVGEGFMMLRMTLIHQWLLIVGLFGFALVKSIRNLVFMRKGEADLPVPVCARYFLLAIMGMGLFSYFVGRSHRDVFLTQLWTAMILLTLFVQEYVSQRKLLETKKSEKCLLSFKFICGSALLLLFAGFYILNIFNSRSLVLVKGKPKATADWLLSSKYYSMAQEVYQTSGIKPDLISAPAALVYAKMEQEYTATIPERCDWFSYDECIETLEYLQSSTRPFLIQQSDLALLASLNKRDLLSDINARFVYEGRIQDQDVLYFAYDEQKQTQTTAEEALVLFATPPGCFIEGAEDGRQWAFNDISTQLAFINLNDMPVRIKLCIDVFASVTDPSELVVWVDKNPPITYQFIDGKLRFEMELELEPDMSSTLLVFGSTAPRFETGKGISRFGMENIEYTILP